MCSRQNPTQAMVLPRVNIQESLFKVPGWLSVKAFSVTWKSYGRRREPIPQNGPHSGHVHMLTHMQCTCSHTLWPRAHAHTHAHKKEEEEGEKEGERECPSNFYYVSLRVIEEWPGWPWQHTL